MGWLANLRIARKLNLGFGVVALLTAGVGTIGITQIVKVQKADAALVDDMAIPTTWIGNIATVFTATRVAIRDAIVQKDPARRASALQKLGVARTRLDSLVGVYGKSLYNSEDTANYTALKADLEAIGHFQDAQAASVRAGRFDEAVRSMNDPANPSGRADSLIAKMVSENVQWMSEEAARNQATAHAALYEMLFVILIALLTAAMLGVLIARSVAGPMSRMTHTA